jgi:purine-binding chemotaxis protein CheW
MTVPAKRTQTDIIQRLLAASQQQEDVALLPERVIEEQLEVLVFLLAGEKYAIPIEHVLEIIRYQESTQVPHTVGFLDGIISLRGEMIPVINGRKRLGHEPKAPDKKTRIIILQEAANRYGILVDGTNHVVRLPQKNIEPTPPVVVGVDAEFIDGICEYKGQLIILLNLQRFLEFT